MTYDTDKVDALLTNIEELKRNWWLGLPGNIAQGVFDAAQALKPQPEMEYVLPEFRPDWRDLDAEPMMRVGKRSYGITEWNELREATRRPKADKVPAGKDWSDDDLASITRVFDSYHSPFVSKSAMREFIDAIKSRCGV